LNLWITLCVAIQLALNPHQGAQFDSHCACGAFAKLLFLIKIQRNPRKVRFFLKKRLRVLWVKLRTPFTGGAEALTGRQTGRLRQRVR
jgi:hypothetical protein